MILEGPLRVGRDCGEEITGHLTSISSVGCGEEVRVFNDDRGVLHRSWQLCKLAISYHGVCFECGSKVAAAEPCISHKDSRSRPRHKANKARCLSTGPVRHEPRVMVRPFYGSWTSLFSEQTSQARSLNISKRS